MFCLDLPIKLDKKDRNVSIDMSRSTILNFLSVQPGQFGCTSSI